jgi:hypothetical protein
MLITLSPDRRALFRADLAAHRARQSLTDADYAARVLRVSLNTFKKCISDEDAPLSLKRHTFVSIFINTELDPARYGLDVTLPDPGSQYGGYRKADFEFLCGRYHLYRRSFLTAQNITRGVVDFMPNETKECLSFREVLSYVADSGSRDDTIYTGDVYIDRDRAMLSLPAFRDGQVRLTSLIMPQRSVARVRMKLRGVLLTFGIPRGFWQPTVSCVMLEGPFDAKRSDPRDLCGTITPDQQGFAAISADLAHTEEHAAVLTPLMWQRLQQTAAGQRPR